MLCHRVSTVEQSITRQERRWVEGVPATFFGTRGWSSVFEAPGAFHFVPKSGL